MDEFRVFYNRATNTVNLVTVTYGLNNVGEEVTHETLIDRKHVCGEMDGYKVMMKMFKQVSRTLLKER